MCIGPNPNFSAGWQADPTTRVETHLGYASDRINTCGQYLESRGGLWNETTMKQPNSRVICSSLIFYFMFISMLIAEYPEPLVR
jgi:hypothetical protein